jgi:hypothetical protein
VTEPAIPLRVTVRNTPIKAGGLRVFIAQSVNAASSPVNQRLRFAL